MTTEDSLKKITKGAGIAFIGVVISKILGYVYRVLIARTDIEIYGLISIGIALFSLLTTISLLGLHKGLLRYVSFYKGKEDFEKIKQTIKTSLKITIPFSIFISVLFFIFSKQISLYFFHTPDLNLVFKIFAFAVPITVFRDLIFSTFQSFQKIKYEVYAKSITENLTKIILTIIFLILGFKTIGLTIAYVLGILIGTLIAFYFLKRKILPSLKTNIIDKSSHSKKELLVYSLPLLFTFIIFSILTWTDTLMLGYFKTPLEVGIYNAALPTAFLMYVIPSTLLALFIPILTGLYAQNKKDIFEQVYKRITKWIFLTNIMLLGIFYLFSKEVLQILFGPDYVTGYIALIILSTGYFIGYLLSTSTSVLIIIKKTKLTLVNTLIITIINIILNLYLIPLYGINGAAIATATAFLTRSLLLMIESYFIIKIIPIKLNYLKILFSAGTSFFIVKYLIYFLSINIHIFSLIFFSILFVLIYMILLFVTKSLEKEDVFILNAIKKKLKF